MTLMKLILSQNYFTFQNKIYHPEKGVSMGSPISSTIAKILLQHLEDIHTHIKQLLNTKNTIFYTRYVDDILIIYNTKQTNKLQSHQQIHKPNTHNIKLNPTHESNGCISVLELLIIRKLSNLEINIFHKPTTTDTTINFLSNHPMEHKIATYRHYITRMHSLPLTPKRKQTEWTLIQLIAQNNNLTQKIIQNLILQIQHQKNQPGSSQQKKQKQKMENLHIVQTKSKENHKPIQAH